ncbi:pentatricopeptide repeat-containing protein At5g09450, mitochondrial-like [Helianthus annuus]|uniref:pentatricopeptide repeat-containing protein At5g09450, mitochondrial-like n=1 Tax=Helianthus annuus TaxID=4232 RepID=UPI000B909E59|nr:pentatricopeptide repeat-containing protein At5g09450, mitochondrial-like [Helianthus annuus]
MSKKNNLSLRKKQYEFELQREKEERDKKAKKLEASKNKKKGSGGFAVGKKVRASEVKQIIHDLRKWRRFHHALEVSEWMNKKGIRAFTPTDRAVQLDLICKVKVGKGSLSFK